jgi:glycosyltransferase involved in cell wall biosynthesis
MSRVDIVVPCYNYGRYLRQCVDSLLTQEGVDVRVLIIDDCSTDDSPEIARAIAAEDSRVEFRRHEKNLGHIATYNEGLLGWVTAEYCLLISADDLLTPGALGRATHVMDGHPSVGLAYGRQKHFVDILPDTQPLDSSEESTIIAGLEFVRTMCETASNPVNTPTAVVRTSVLHEVGGYLPELPHTADMELWLRVAACSDVAVQSACQALKRAHPAQMQTHFVEQPVRDFKQRRLAIEMFYDARADQSAVPSAWRDAAIRSLAEQSFWEASRRVDSGLSKSVDELLDYAKELDPQIVGRGTWTRLSWKRRLGPRGWRIVRPWMDCLRGKKKSANSAGGVR